MVKNLQAQTAADAEKPAPGVVPKAVVVNNYSVPVFYGIQNYQQFSSHLEGVIRNTTHGYFVGDSLVTLGKSLSFIKDRKFAEAFFGQADETVEKSIIWRVHTLAWAAKRGLDIEGDFVECGCYTGKTSKIIFDHLGLENSDKSFYLYDLFTHSADMDHNAMPKHGEDLYMSVCERFAAHENVHVIQGAVPDTLHGTAPEKIAYLHIDMNSVTAEIGALEMLFDRVTPGGAIVLDDYGWVLYQDQMAAHQEFFGSRGCPILELPTGQGLVIK